MKSAYALHNISQAYGEEVVLTLERLDIEAGHTTVLVGPNGSGKSTLLDLLAFLRPPRTGWIKFFDEFATSGRYHELRRLIGYVQQKPYLLNTSVAHNIELGLKLRGVGKKERQSRTAAIIEEFGLRPLAARRAHDLSGGEVQKVAIARALVPAPRVLILDEPFAHLDSRFKSDLEELIYRIKREKGRTIIFSTHDRLQAQLFADHICSLADGRVVPVCDINSYSGKVCEKDSMFITDRMRIHIPPSIKQGSRLSVESNQLVLSRSRLQSSMRNCFQGRVKSLREEGGRIHASVDAGELFHVLITKEALNELAINVGDTVWLSFKSSAVNVYS